MLTGSEREDKYTFKSLTSRRHILKIHTVLIVTHHNLTEATIIPNTVERGLRR